MVPAQQISRVVLAALLSAGGCTNKDRGEDARPVAGASPALPATRAPAEAAAQTPAEASASLKVEVHGALHEMMHMGRTERRVDLAPLISQAGTFGLGALEDLGGEVTVWDGQLWLSTPDGQGGAVAQQMTETTAGATLLVTSKVHRWQERPITEAVSFAALDDFIKQQASAAGVDVEEAFAFRVEGTPSRLDWHVIDGSKIPSGAHGHEAHMQTAVRGSLAALPVQILGFYSPKHHSIFTHHDTNTHAHVLSESAGVSGHVDHVDLVAGARLWLPAPGAAPEGAPANAL